MSGTAYPRWPDYALPAPSLSDSLSMEYPDVVLRTDFDQGPTRQRSMYDGGATMQWITWPMNATQLRIFHGFWRGELANGANWFVLPLFIDNDYYDTVVRFVKGSLGSSSQGSITRADSEWMYTAQVETMDEIAPDEFETAELLLTYCSTTSLSDLESMLRGALDTISGAI